MKLRWRSALSAVVIAVLLDAPARAGDPASYVQAAQQYLKKGDLKSALIELRNAAQQAPQDPKIRVELATLYLRLGDPASAVREARAARERNGAEAGYLPILAEGLLQQGKFADVLGQVEPDDRPPAIESKIRLAIGLADAGLNHPDKAEAELRNAVRLDPNSPTAKIALAQLLVSQDPAEAGKLIDQVLAANPRLADAVVVKGMVSLAQHDRDGALRQFDSALTIDPNNLLARLSRAALYIEEHKFAAADADLDPLLKVSPGNAQATYLRAVELFREQKYAAADAILERLRPVFDRLLKGYYLQAAVKFDLGQYAQAEDLAAKYSARVPADTNAVRLAALAALRQQAPNRAIGYLKPVADKAPGDAKVLSLLGEAYLVDGQPEQALQQYRKAAALEPGNPEIDTAVAVSEIGAGNGTEGVKELERIFDTAAGATVAGPTLVLTELRAGRADQAAAAADKLVERDPKNPLYQTLLGSARLQQRDYAAAERAFRTAVALRPDFDAPTRNLAQLYLGTGRPASAATTYQSLLAKKPDDITALIGLAQVAVAEKQWPRAEEYLNRARAAAPNAPVPGIQLVDFYLARRQPQRAAALAGLLTTQFPTDADVLDAQGRAQTAAGDKQGAVSAYKRAYELAPDSAPILSHYLALLTASKDFAAARAVLEQAVHRYPNNVALKAELIRVDAQAGGLQAGLATAHAFAKGDPENPTYAIVSSELYESAGKIADAEAVLEQAEAANPSKDVLTLALAALYQRAAQPDKAEALLQSRLSTNPKDAGLEAALASLYLNEKNYPAAVAAYQRLVAERPKDPAVLNNLGWLYRQQGDLAKASQLAGQALALAPGNSQIEDTLGWILLAQGEAGQAVTHLTAAEAGAPADPNIQYHLAVALDRAGKPMAARTILEKLLSSDAGFADEAAAQKLLQQLKNG